LSTDVPRSLIEIGRVSKAHGVRGELKVVLHWAESDSLEHVGEVFLGKPSAAPRKFEIRALRPAGRVVLLSLAGIDDRDTAEGLRGAAVLVSRADLPPLEPGEYYLCDLVGASVESPEGIVGEVVEVRMHPSVDTLIVRAPDGRLYEQPLAEPWILSVDTGGKRVELRDRGGLISP